MTEPKPIEDRIFVFPDETQRALGTMKLPESARTEANKGTVRFVGPGKPGLEMRTKQGDRVAFGRFSGVTYTHEGEQLLVMRESELLAIL